MPEEITVKILNFNCLKDGRERALTANSNNLTLQSSSNSDNQKWRLIPNLALSGAAGGYTLFNVGKEQAAEQPPGGQQVRLNDDPTPYGNQTYCWTFFNAGEDDGEQLWAIQTFDRGDSMDAEGGSCSSGTKVLRFRFRGRDNQKWVVRRV